MSRAQSPGTFPIIKTSPSLQDYLNFFPNMDWIVCQALNCNCVIRKRYIMFNKFIIRVISKSGIRGDESWFHMY